MTGVGAAATAALRRWPRSWPAPRGLPGPSRWGWAADALLALVLAVGTVSADLDRDYVHVHGDGPGPGVDVPREPGEPGRQPGPRGEAWEGSGVPGLPPGSRPVYPVVEHALGPVPWWGLCLAVLTAAPLAWRRRSPLAVFWAVLGTTVLFHLGEVSADATAVTFASVLIAGYSAAMYSPHRKAAAVSLPAGAVLLAALELVPEVGSSLLPLLVLVPIAMAANAIHAWRQRVRAMQAEQEAATRLAVDEERHRIARELHDVVTHNVSMMTIQAGAARKVLDAEPDQAREAMRAVETAGRSAMAELRQVMGLLTAAAGGPGAAADAPGGPGPDGPEGLAPQPGLARLPALVDGVRATGTDVELRVTGTPVDLPAGVDLAAYRVVQEGLTNAVKHASGARVTVGVAYAPGELRVDVRDTGGTPTAAEGGGRGLIGLRERLAVHGATLHAGRRPRGGYRVRAVIPVEDP